MIVMKEKTPASQHTSRPGDIQRNHAPNGNGKGDDLAVCASAPPLDALREGETRLCMMGPSGALFETDYHTPDIQEPVLSVLWINADASGYMDVANGDRILSVRR